MRTEHPKPRLKLFSVIPPFSCSNCGPLVYQLLHVLRHVKVAGPDLRARMKGAGAVAAIQPSFVPSDVSTVMKRLRFVDLQEWGSPFQSLFFGARVCVCDRTSLPHFISPHVGRPTGDGGRCMYVYVCLRLGQCMRLVWCLLVPTAT